MELIFQIFTGDADVNDPGLDWDISSISSGNSVPEIYISQSESSVTSEISTGDAPESDEDLQLIDSVS